MDTAARQGLPRLVGFDRTDLAVREGLSAFAAAVAARASAIAAGRPAPPAIRPVRVERRRRGAQPVHLLQVVAALVAVDDALSQLATQRDRATWSDDAASVLIFVRDALRTLGRRLEALDDAAALTTSGEAAASLSEARRRLRVIRIASLRFPDQIQVVERAYHVELLHTLLRECAVLRRTIDRTAYARG